MQIPDLLDHLKPYPFSFEIELTVMTPRSRTFCISRISRRERMSKTSLLLSSVLRLVLRRECLAFLSDSFLFDLVDETGFEPVTFCLQSSCATSCATSPKMRNFQFFNLQILFSMGSRFVDDSNIDKSI